MHGGELLALPGLPTDEVGAVIFSNALEVSPKERDEHYLTYVRVAMLMRWVRLWVAVVVFGFMTLITVALAFQGDWFVGPQLVITAAWFTFVRSAWRWDATIK